MFTFVKSLSQKIGEQVQLVILAVLSVVAIYIAVGSSSGVLDVISDLLPILLVLSAVWLLFIKKKILASYVVLLLLVFSNGINIFINWLFSYHFFLERFSYTFSINTIFLLVGCIYLMVMIASLLMTEGIKLEIKKLDMVLLLLLFGLYVYINNSFTSLIFVGIYLFFALNAGEKLAALALMLSGIIATPFIIFQRFVDNAAKMTTIHMWLTDAFALFLIYFVIMHAIPLFGKKKIETKEAE